MLPAIMLPRDKILEETSPLSIFFVKSGSGGNRLLFRYPFDDQEHELQLCNIHKNLCGQKFEIKINSVRHVGHPTSLAPTLNGLNNNNDGDITSFNIVCSLRASASFDIVECYHDLSKRLAIALSFEERRCSYLSNEVKTILAALEENDMANLVREEQNRQDSVFAVILERSSLAKDLKKVFISLTTDGIVDVKINNWISVSFCLSQRVHRLQLLTHKSMPAIGTDDIKKCLNFLRPYHGLLLLYETQELLESLPIDASPAFIQVIKVTKPDKNFTDLSVDANLTLMQVYCIVSQLIYWAKATIIYPICDSNIYAIHPLASIGIHSELAHDFRTSFPHSRSLHQYLADFSEGISLSQLNRPLLNLDEKLNLLSIVTWLLRKRILIQIHKYIFLVHDSEQQKTDYLSKDIISSPGCKSPEDIKLLNRLTPYFNGKHHIEDIMFFENLDRSEILILCDKFRDILFTCSYEDVAVNQLSPLSKTI